jgi:hypothetical protein
MPCREKKTDTIRGQVLPKTKQRLQGTPGWLSPGTTRADECRADALDL